MKRLLLQQTTGKFMEELFRMTLAAVLLAAVMIYDWRVNRTDSQ